MTTKRFICAGVIMILSIGWVFSQKLFNVHSTIHSNFNDIEYGMIGCCMGFCAGNLRASSTLNDQGENSYVVEMLKDDSRSTAWVEGVDGNGIGEYLEFDYTYDIDYEWSAEYECKYSDRFLIANGLQKDQNIFYQNGRVKKLKMYINNQPYCFIHLKDQMGVQSVKLEFLKNLGKEKDTIRIKLEIMEIYPGTKYKDTAISEIYW